MEEETMMTRLIQWLIQNRISKFDRSVYGAACYRNDSESKCPQLATSAVDPMHVAYDRWTVGNLDLYPLLRETVSA
jgi:hypothetical protein